MASINFLKCLVPLEVTASGNSATFSFVERVTFLTSKKTFLSKKPSILTTGCEIKDHEIKDKHTVKVYVNDNICVNFSRKKICKKNIFKHIGVYVFQSKIIDKLLLLKKTKREQNESLEQLRWLQNNYEINFTKRIYNVISINSKQDLLDL